MLTSNKDSNNKNNVDNLKPQIQTEIKNLNNLNIEDNLIESNNNHNLFNLNKNYILKSDIYQSEFKDINSFKSGKINNNNLFS